MNECRPSKVWTSDFSLFFYPSLRPSKHETKIECSNTPSTPYCRVYLTYQHESVHNLDNLHDDVSSSTSTRLFADSGALKLEVHRLEGLLEEPRKTMSYLSLTRKQYSKMQATANAGLYSISIKDT